MNRRIRKLQALSCELHARWSKACLAYHAAPLVDRFDHNLCVEAIEHRVVTTKALINYLITNHKARLARRLNVPHYDGIAATPDDKFFRHLRYNSKTYGLLSCGKSLAGIVIRHNLTCAR